MKLPHIHIVWSCPSCNTTSLKYPITKRQFHLSQKGAKISAVCNTCESLKRVHPLTYRALNIMAVWDEAHDPFPSECRIPCKDLQHQ